MKTCTKCGETKPETEYTKRAENKRDGLRAQCKDCSRIVKDKWNAENNELVRAYSTKWAAENREKVKAVNANYYAANTDKVRSSNAKWYAANKDSWRIYAHNRRARKGGTLSVGLSDKLFKLQRGKCACGCGEPLGGKYHLDHIMPLALGGTNTDDNIQLLRSTCNQQKHAKHPVAFMQSRGYLI